MQPEPDATRATILRTAVSAIVTDRDGRILLQRRSDNGRWGVPGGGVEIGETVRDAVVREVREETGLSVEVVRLIGVYSDPAFQVVRYPDGNVVHYVSLFFQCQIRGGELATCDETLELGFFEPRDLPGSLLPMHRIRIQDALSGAPTAFIR